MKREAEEKAVKLEAERAERERERLEGEEGGGGGGETPSRVRRARRDANDGERDTSVEMKPRSRVGARGGNGYRACEHQ